MKYRETAYKTGEYKQISKKIIIILIGHKRKTQLKIIVIVVIVVIVPLLLILLQTAILERMIGSFYVKNKR